MISSVMLRSRISVSVITACCVLVVGTLTGCSAVHTSIAKRNLDVQTKMSDSIFLEPVEPAERVLFINVRNTSDKTNFDIMAPIKEAMVKKGYRVTENPKEAHYRLEASVLQVSKGKPEEAQAALSAGFGGAIGGAVAGGVIGGAAGGWYGAGIGAGAGGILGALGATAADAYVQDVLFMVITDVQLVEKAADGVIVRQDSAQNLAQGKGGTQQQTSSEVTKNKKYRTRIVSTANKANLEYEEAAPLLTEGLTRSLSGIF